MVRYLVVWSTVIEDFTSPYEAAVETLRLMRDPEFDGTTFHVREVMDRVGPDGDHDLGPVIEVQL